MNAPSTRKIVVAGPVSSEQSARVRDIAASVEIEFVGSVADASDLDYAEVIAGQLSPSDLERAGSLKWLHSWAAGPDSQLFDQFVGHPAVLTCSKGNGAIPLAEHAMMLMMLLNRNALRWIEAQREQKWAPFVHEELNGKTVGIIGTGHSGTDLAGKAKAFHMSVIGMRRTQTPATGFDRIYPHAELHDFLKESDFVVVTAPKTPETEGMLGEVEFRAMKKSAYYICYSRGGVADDRALLRALEEGWIAGAGLDAHGEEPLPADSPFWKAPNTIITPHNGATTSATKARGFEIFLDNLRRYVKGEPLFNVVDKLAGY